MFAPDMRRSNGFTLIELVIVMIIISVGFVGIAALFSNTSKSLTTNEVLQQAAQYAQECAESAIATRRNLGFASASINSTMCDLPAMAPGFTRTVTVPATTTGTTTSACPNLATCRNVTITVTSGALSSSITVMLVDY